jgi:hypothetical protein
MYPFDRPTNYGEMLNKIGLSTFFLALGLTWVVSYFSPAATLLLEAKKTDVEIVGVHLPLLHVIPAILLAIIFRIFRLHDKISDLLRIRANFDVDQILVPLCEAVRVTVDQRMREKLKEHREDAMERTYYAYASFEDPKISKATVLASIDRWTWYWILLEFMALLMTAGVILIALHSLQGACFIFAVLSFCAALFCTYTKSCGRLAVVQIREITADAIRTTAIKTAFTKLSEIA